MIAMITQITKSSTLNKSVHIRYIHTEVCMTFTGIFILLLFKIKSNTKNGPEDAFFIKRNPTFF